MKLRADYIEGMFAVLNLSQHLPSHTLSKKIKI